MRQLLVNVVEKNKKNIVVIEMENHKPLIFDTASALDLAMSLNYHYQTTDIILRKEAVINGFYDLSSGIAGEILQKYINYDIHLAIIGDFSEGSQALKDFIREANKGNNFYFVSTFEEAVDCLGK
ncbi:DUF4180 domain-containing protein [Enterococcus sp. DIV2371]|uniref:DUF4180 domain-containing protein n=1 Tax=unclassified Enterococcus TaxID=2608891 RepID=UPI003D2930B2